MRRHWRAASPLVSWALAGACASLVAILVTVAMGPLPTGNDPGNWLAQSRLLWTATPGGVPRPFVPALVGVLAPPFGPVEGARLAGVASLLSVCIALFWVLRSHVAGCLAAASVLVIGLSRPLNETVAFGGYPQNFALAFAVIATWVTARYLARGRTADRILASAALCLCALSHHVYFVLCLGTVGVAWLSWVASPASAAVRSRRSLGLAAPILASLAAFAPTIATFAGAGYEAPTGLHQGGVWASLGTAFGNSTTMYAPILVLGGVYGVSALLRREPGPALRAAGALTIVAWAVFAAGGEPRVLPLVFGAAVMGTAMALDELSAVIRVAPARAGLVAMYVGLASMFAVFAARANGPVYDYYRVLDHDLLAAIETLDAQGDGEAVAVLAGKDRWPVGWWFEGLGHRPVVTGSDPRWLAFPAERRAAGRVAILTAAGISSATSAQKARRIGIGFVAFDKRYWDGWQLWLSEASPAVKVFFDRGNFMVLQYVEAGIAVPREEQP